MEYFWSIHNMDKIIQETKNKKSDKQKQLTISPPIIYQKNLKMLSLEGSFYPPILTTVSNFSVGMRFRLHRWIEWYFISFMKTYFQSP